MDSWAWEQLEPWQQLRVRFPVGRLLCVIHGPTAGRHWDQASAPRQLARTAATAGVRHRLPHIRCVMPTRSSWPTRRSLSSSSTSWAMPTSASPRSICKESTARRSSMPFTPADCRRSRRPPACAAAPSSRGIPRARQTPTRAREPRPGRRPAPQSQVSPSARLRASGPTDARKPWAPRRAGTSRDLLSTGRASSA